MTHQKMLNDKQFELTVDTLVRLRADTPNETDVLAKILKEGITQRGNYEISVVSPPGLYGALVRVVHPKNILRASIDVQGSVHVIENSGAVKSFPVSEIDDALGHLFLQIIQRT